jgi:hypothetical protein
MKPRNPSGGLLWHWRGWRNQTRWEPTREQIANWLSTIEPETERLLLIGASAGWMLPMAWLLRFKHLEIWDLDPWAPWFFRRRHGGALKQAGVTWRYHTGDALARLPELLVQDPQAFVFFDNVLGQLRFMQKAKPASEQVRQTEQALQQAVAQLQGRHWASIHDRLSGPVDDISAQRGMLSARTGLVMPDERQQLRSDRAWLNILGAQGEWLDHLTATVFPPGQTVKDMAWPFRPRYWHWLQAGEVKP